MIIQKGRGLLVAGKKKSNRPLSKLAYAEEFEGDAERRTAAYSNVREDSSTASTYKLPAEVEFRKRSNILMRVLSALVIGPVFIIAIMFIKSLFYLLMLLIAVGMLYEWYQMTKPSFFYGLLGFIIIPIPIISLVIIATEDKNRWLLLLYFTIIWSVDIFAMIGGKNIGGIKLAPKISPNKTWSGLITGVLASGVAAFLLSLLPGFDLPTYYLLNKRHLIIAAFCLALIAQMSDLFISYFKRKFAIKDSGTIIPGHGGVLDRFDSIILTAPILFLLLKYYELSISY